jgi:hypothetical protein
MYSQLPTAPQRPYVRGVAQTKPDRRNRAKTVHVGKNLTKGYFSTLSLPIETHF